MPTLTNVNEEAILAIGRTPLWSRQGDTEGPPDSATSGVSLGNPVSVYLSIGVREVLHQRTARVTVSSFDAAATYTATIDGTPANKATPSDPDDLLTGLRDAINAAAGSTVTVTALDEDDADVTSSGGEATSLLIAGDSAADYSLALSATGTGVLAGVVDAASATAKLYVKPNGTAATSSDVVPGWRAVSGATGISLTQIGMHERINAAGASRAYIELDGLTGHGSDAGVTYRRPDVDFGIAVAS